MSDVNLFVMIGRLGGDPEIRVTPSGKKVAVMSIATSEEWKDKSGNKMQSTQWHRVVAYEKLAEIIEQYLKKGSQVFVEGRVTYKQWKHSSGVDMTSTEIIMSKMQMLGGGSSNPNRSVSQEKQAVTNETKPRETKPKLYENATPIDLDEDIPF